MSWGSVSDVMNQLLLCVLVVEEVGKENVFTAGEARVKPPSIRNVEGDCVSVMIRLQVVWKFLDGKEMCGTGREIEVFWYIMNHLLNLRPV